MGVCFLPEENYTFFLYQRPQHSEYSTVMEFLKYKLDDFKSG